MKTIFLIDACTKIAPQKHDVAAKHVARCFRPGDDVGIFNDLRSHFVVGDSQGNPTAQQIRKMISQRGYYSSNVYLALQSLSEKLRRDQRPEVPPNAFRLILITALTTLQLAAVRSCEINQHCDPKPVTYQCVNVDALHALQEDSWKFHLDHRLELIC